MTVSRITASDDIAARVAQVTTHARTPGYVSNRDSEAVDIEAWNHVGDPLAEALVNEMRERKLMGGDHFATAQALEAQAVPAAVAFFADVTTVPDWVDFEFMRSGARMAGRNPLGMALGFHGGLAFTYIDPATARVMGGTGRLADHGAIFRRRYWETAKGFIGALDVDGMRPGGPRWEQWVRIRLLHSMIRLGIHRGERWDRALGAPISQLATASCAHIFGTYRVEVIRAVGGRATAQEEASFNMMWRWIARIEGANAELLGTTDSEQLRLAERMHQHLYNPDQSSRQITNDMIDGLAAMPEFRMPRTIHAAIVRRLLRAQHVQTLPGLDVATDLGVRTNRFADAAVSSAVAALALIGHVHAYHSYGTYWMRVCPRCSKPPQSVDCPRKIHDSEASRNHSRT